MGIVPILSGFHASSCQVNCCRCRRSATETAPDRTSRPGPHSKIPGARMKTALYGSSASADALAAPLPSAPLTSPSALLPTPLALAAPLSLMRKTGGDGSCVSKLLICAPKKLRCTRQSKPPNSAWPPCFWPVEIGCQSSQRCMHGCVEEDLRWRAGLIIMMAVVSHVRIHAAARNISRRRPLTHLWHGQRGRSCRRRCPRPASAQRRISAGRE